MRVVLTWWQMQLGAFIGSQRMLSNMKAGRKPRYGAHQIDGAWDKNILGALAEMAVAKTLGKYWDGNLDNFGAPDVGDDVQVRATTRLDGRLIVHPGEKMDDQFFLVICEPPVFDIVGYLFGADAQKQDYWWADAPNPAFFVPRKKLIPVEMLLTLREGEQ